MIIVISFSTTFIYLFIYFDHWLMFPRGSKKYRLKENVNAIVLSPLIQSVLLGKALVVQDSIVSSCFYDHHHKPQKSFVLAQSKRVFCSVG